MNMMRIECRFRHCLGAIAAAAMCVTALGQDRGITRDASVLLSPTPGNTREKVTVETVFGMQDLFINPAREQVVLDDLGMAVVKRRPVAKQPDASLKLTPQTNGRLTVKFADDLLVRMQGGVLQTTGADAGQAMAELKQILQRSNLSIRPVFEKTADEIAAITGRARQMSGYVQPDLAGMFYIEGEGVAPAAFEAAARRLNGMDAVEFVQFEPRMVVDGGGAGGACCLPIEDPPGNCVVDCIMTDSQTCEDIGGFSLGVGSMCGGLPGCDPTIGACCVNGECRTLPRGACIAGGGTPIECATGGPRSCLDESISCDEEPDCGDPGAGSCFEVGVANCDNEECCEAVCQIDPFCCDPEVEDVFRGRGFGRWDSTCIFIATSLPTEGVQTLACAGGEVCGNFLDNSCSVAGDAGCSNYGCCATVCNIDPDCCAVAWDNACVILADANCLTPPSSAGPIPNFAGAQGYLTEAATFNPPPAEVFATLPRTRDELGFTAPLPDYNGTGMDIDGMEGFAQFLLDEFGVGDTNGALGAGRKIAIIEHSANVDHFEFEGRITAEPGQTILIIPGSMDLDGHHGTSTLAIAGATDHGDPGRADEIGVVGVAPQSELLFFPIVSVENPGGRTLNAILNSFDFLSNGDVISLSIGPDGCGTLLNNIPAAVLLQTASDLGITSCLSAGNDDCDLDSNPSPSPTGAIVVAAVTPGAPHCRIGFSNFGSRVDCSAWGDFVVTAGGGGLYNNGNPNEVYTSSFNGTSAAAPMIAGLVARYQGFAQQFFGQFLTPAQIRGIMGGNGLRECSREEGQPFYGNDPDANALGDYQFQIEPNLGIFPDPLIAAESMITATLFDGNPFIDDIEVIRGDHLAGSSLQILAPDGNYFVVQSEYTGRGVQSIDSDKAPANRVNYIAAGETVDLLVYAHAFFSGRVTNMAVNTQYRASNGSGLVILELWDWTNNRWAFGGFTTFSPLDQGFSAELSNAERFVNSNRSVVIRLYSVSVGGQSTDIAGNQVGATPYAFLLDWVQIEPLDFTIGFEPGPGSIGGLGAGGSAGSLP